MIRSLRSYGVFAVFVGASLTVAACSGGSGPTGPTPVPSPSQTQGGPAPTPTAAPQPVPAPAPAPAPAPTSGNLTVRVDTSCSGKESNISVYIDNRLITTLQPGGSTSQTVSVGEHQVMATAPTGTRWGPSTVNVGTGGFTSTLNCTGSAPAPAPAPTTGILRVMVDADCQGKASNIDISIDGLYVGTTQPGSTGVSKSVSIGNHTVFGRAPNGTTWGTLTVAVSANGYSQNFTCR